MTAAPIPDDETPGAFGPGFVYNPAVFGKPDATFIRAAEATTRPSDCPDCGAEYPYCDCGRDEDAEADAREGWYTAMEILDA